MASCYWQLAIGYKPLAIFGIKPLNCFRSIFIFSSSIGGGLSAKGQGPTAKDQKRISITPLQKADDLQKAAVEDAARLPYK